MGPVEGNLMTGHLELWFALADYLLNRRAYIGAGENLPVRP